MAPQASEHAASPELETLVAPQAAPRKYRIVYPNVVLFSYLHTAGLYGLYLCFTTAKWQTVVLAFIWFVMGMIGIITGAHRLWSHRSFKARKPLQILLMLMNSIGYQNTATDWVRDHRLHHKYSDTDADPHNASRGVFYSHVGWLLVRKHEEVKRRGATIYMADIYGNPVLQFQKKYAIPLIGALCFVLPTLVPVYCWGETISTAWHVCILRYCLNLNGSFLTNSAAHKFGTKPYDKSICPSQNILATIITLGEGFHNYHHSFPWDYRAAELGNNILNPNTWFIDFFAKIGWAYDLKTASDDLVKKRMARTGDGKNSWGWWDVTKEERDGATIRFPQKEQVRDGNFCGCGENAMTEEERDSATKV